MKSMARKRSLKKSKKKIEIRRKVAKTILICQEKKSKHRMNLSFRKINESDNR